LLKTGEVTELSLDYDLGIETITGNGYDVCLWIENETATNNFDPPHLVIHSDNPAGIEKMRLAIRSIERLVENRRR
jgi:hypothetical protein